ncbi:selenite/tellurite reduction operon c-type cytochrome lipoprotein ExtS [Geomonas silvestris]|uniref:selenite/tellurite reduction operon c-type cytochrome lipoprotein ExtS n=1 Tax=Geomonas silvestris TaxID=2740184 RepID=UPI00160862F4|nr:selenite/tellurite reduction operon c-type cytochrome lipoprotein ExtS [Geomonas silvestris]
MLLAALVVMPGTVQAARSSCLRCHRPHYAQLGSCEECHRGDGRSERLAIAHRDLVRGRYAWSALAGSEPLARGEKLVELFACRRCHTLAGKGNHLASDLDRLGKSAVPEQLERAIRTPAFFMPDFQGSDHQVDDLVVAILAGALKGKKGGKEGPQLVHFEGGRGEERVFQKQCGPCHKALTGTWGGLGRGNVGPNLSGLFSDFYPKTWQQGERWTAEALRKWLQNPRAHRQVTQMLPLRLSKAETERLLAELQSGR